jgi:phage terminase Nu1 subunit (DNA packaging protein)
MKFSVTESVLSLLALAQCTGLIITAKDFYTMKERLKDKIREAADKIHEELDERYVLKEVHNSEIKSLKEDIDSIKTGQQDVQNTVTRIYEFLLRNYRGREDN